MMRIIVMGVSGSGKSTVGAALAEKLGLPFLEGDSLHPQSNIEKMSAGIPLIDDDRWPWLDQIGARLAQAPDGIVISCSALKKTYRDRLREAAGSPLHFVFLDGSLAVLREHMGHRTGHFMPLAMLDSQLATLEPPTGEPLVLRQDIAEPIDRIVEASMAWLRGGEG
ncbi:gluconokinase [Paramesorhizobium deserti]|uniref:Gluconokinase n=1 Tax=Paramesorhizobium deserti TaxID=1494590 RepID=A0A135HPH1_9HYPH|nr:gluconokinase [Paramesorhizobium deserti]KXF75070.1 gluconokinase [Paramesorhizobium deserti]